jgi:hypothetical protein
MSQDAFTTPPRASRRWLWWIPAGCLLAILLMVGFGLAMLWLVGAALDETDAYQEPLRRAQASEEVRALLGEPIEAGWLPQGQIKFSTGDGGRAELSIPVSGPRGKAVIEVRATKRAGEDVWTYARLELVPEGEAASIDLR